MTQEIAEGIVRIVEMKQERKDLYDSLQSMEDWASHFAKQLNLKEPGTVDKDGPAFRDIAKARATLNRIQK